MISALYLINSKGDIILYRKYRDDVARNAAENFRLHVIADKNNDVVPITIHNKCFFFHIRVEDMYVVIASRQNVHAVMCFNFLYSLVDVYKSYFDGKFNEKTVRNNFVLIYELLDEVMDFGYPQITNDDMLQLYILSEKLKRRRKKDASASSASDVTVQATGAVSWRAEGIRHKKNEIYIDVIEEVNLLVGKNGRHIRADVSGQVVCKALLSGMPDCQLGLNDRIAMDQEGRRDPSGSGKGGGRSGLKDPHAGATQIEMDDLVFHQCVKLNKFETDRSISFVPPDGEFELMRYRIADRIIIPFRVSCNIIDETRSRVRMEVHVKSLVEARLFAINVQVHIPVPDNAASATFVIDPKAKNMQGHKVRFKPAERVIVWKMKRFQGKTDISLGCDVSLVASMKREKVWSKPPIAMSFQVPMFMSSGIHVRYLKILEKSDYPSTKWIRYLSKTGQYEHRIADGRELGKGSAPARGGGAAGEVPLPSPARGVDAGGYGGGRDAL
jgi:AP-2 complex subunit mu-1